MCLNFANVGTLDEVLLVDVYGSSESLSLENVVANLINNCMKSEEMHMALEGTCKKMQDYLGTFPKLFLFSGAE